MPGCSSRQHLLLGIAILLLGESISAQQRSDVVSDNLLAQLSDSIQSIATQVSPAIVQIEVLGYIHPDEDKRDDKDRSDTHIVTKTNVIASGVIMSTDGYIITSAHTVNGAKRVRVNLDNRVRAPQWESVPPVLTFDAKVVGKCEQADLALLKIDVDGLPTIPLVDSNTVHPGTLVVAIGNPEGLTNSVSMGIVSAVARSDNADRPVPYIQTDAPINPGSSGGALVDMNGGLIGITSFMVTEGGGSDGLGFALPSNLVQIIYQELKTRGHVRVGEIGIRVQNITSTLARGLGLSQDWGAVVSDVEPNSPAEIAGLNVRDVLVSLDGEPVTGLPQFNASFYSKRVGDRVSLEVSRSGASLRFDVPVLENSDEESDDPINSILDESSRVAELGVMGIPVNERPRSDASRRRSKSGVVVVAKLDHTQQRTDLAMDDLIRSVNGRPVSTVKELRSEIEKYKSGESVVLQIERNGRLMYVSFEMD
jgi:serine protease Do